MRSIVLHDRMYTRNKHNKQFAGLKFQDQKRAFRYIACLHDQNKSGFLEGRLLSSQSEQSKKFSKSSDWLKKIRPSKKATFALIMQTG